jgi:hypothetical protein
VEVNALLPFALLLQAADQAASDQSGTVRIVAGVLAVALVVIIILRRKGKKKKTQEDDF